MTSLSSSSISIFSPSLPPLPAVSMPANSTAEQNRSPRTLSARFCVLLLNREAACSCCLYVEICQTTNAGKTLRVVSTLEAVHTVSSSAIPPQISPCSHADYTDGIIAAAVVLRTPDCTGVVDRSPVCGLHTVY